MKFLKNRLKLLKVKNLFKTLLADKEKENKILEKHLIQPSLLFNLFLFQHFFLKLIGKNIEYKLDIDWKDKIELKINKFYLDWKMFQIILMIMIRERN